MLYYLTVGLTIVSSILYHVFLKVTPANINPLISLSITYLTACIVTLLMIPLYSGDKLISIIDSMRELNWASYALGVAIVGLEVGTLLAYRAGWNISLFNIVACTTVTVLLIPIGLLYFRESLTNTTIAGLVFCLIGLILINYKV